MIKGALIKIFILSSGLFAASSLFGQTPQSINYQAVARNTDTGEELVNQDLFVSAKVREGGPQGEIVYQENHSSVVTNAFGLFSLQIGEGESVVGSFAEIDWSPGNLWLEIDLDIGNGLETIGAMQFVSVPYALYAERAGNVDDADADPNNESITDMVFLESSNNLSITESGESYTVDLTSLKNDADADPQNEIITNLSYEPSSSVLTISEAGNSNDVTLDFDVDDADADPENELIDPDDGLVLSGTILEINEGGVQHEVDLANLVDDEDADPANELISSTNGLVLDGDSMLQVTEGGTLHEVNLSSLIDDEDWQRSSNGNTIYNTTDKVGIGISNPNSTFHLNGSVAYTSQIIEPGASNSSYTVGTNDHIIICKCDGEGSLEIEMPDPTVAPGRVVTIMRTGNFMIDGLVTITFGTWPLDYLPQSPVLSGAFGTSAMSFMSLGSDGWITISQ